MPLEAVRPERLAVDLVLLALIATYPQPLSRAERERRGLAHSDGLPSTCSEPLSARQPKRDETAFNLRPTCIDPVTPVLPTVATARDHRGPPLTVSDNDDTIRGLGTVRKAVQSMRAPAARGRRQFLGKAVELFGRAAV